MLNNSLKKLVLFLLIAAANFLISLRTEIGFFYWFFLFLAAIAVLFLFLVAVEYFGVKIRLERIVAGKVDSGDTLRVKAVLRNTGFLPVMNLLLEDHLSCAPEGAKQALALIEYLGPGKTIEIEYSCLCPRRGKYKLGPFRMYFFDPLGLFFLKRTCRDCAEIYVYPRTFPIHKFPALAKGIVPWFGIDTSRSSGDDDEFFGVREYRPGDPIKRIHWFSTALKNRLIVKQFQRQVFSRATIMFNLNRDKDYGDGEDSTGEYTVKIAASVARHFIEQGVSLELIAHAGEVVHMPFNKGEEHLDDILKFLSIARSQSDTGLREIFEEFSRNIPDHTSVVVIMLDRDWDILPVMLPLEKRNISLIPLVLISSTFKYSLDSPEMVRDVKIKLSQAFHFAPVFFSRKDNLEEAFLH